MRGSAIEARSEEEGRGAWPLKFIQNPEFKFQNLDSRIQTLALGESLESQECVTKEARKFPRREEKQRPRCEGINYFGGAREH